MRILSGKLKGRSILTQSLPYRPTQSRVRKSLFDILGSLQGKSFCDGYAGSGIMGLEAWSRGAQPVTFIEQNSKIYSLLKKNVERFHIADCVPRKGDYLRVIPSLDPFDIIFTDPPYALAGDKKHMEEMIAVSIAALNPSGIYILETTGDFAQFPADRHKQYGDTTLLFWRK